MDKREREREKNIMLPSLERSMSRVFKQYGCNREVVVVVVLVRTREVEGIIILLKVFFRFVMVMERGGQHAAALSDSSKLQRNLGGKID